MQASHLREATSTDLDSRRVPTERAPIWSSSDAESSSTPSDHPTGGFAGRGVHIVASPTFGSGRTFERSDPGRGRVGHYARPSSLAKRSGDERFLHPARMPKPLLTQFDVTAVPLALGEAEHENAPDVSDQTISDWDVQRSKEVSAWLGRKAPSRRTWWTSASMSIVGVQLAPASTERDAAHVHVRVEPRREVLGDRTDGRRATPRREPGLPALKGSKTPARTRTGCSRRILRCCSPSST